MAYLDKKFVKNNAVDKSSISISTLQQRHLYPLTAVCQSHPSDIFTNYCTNSKCMMPLCPDCIETHVEEHKRLQIYPYIESVKNARIKCIRKVHRLSEMFQNQLGGMDGPKNIEKICADTVLELNRIKSFMIQSIEGYFLSLEDTIKQRVAYSASIFREMDTIHGRLRQIIEELANLDYRLHSNTPATIPTMRKVFSLDGNGLSESFMAELNNFNIIRKKANIDVRFDEGIFNHNIAKFRQALSYSIVFDKTGGTQHPLALSKLTTHDYAPQYIETPKNEQLLIRDSNRFPTRPLLHFFESNTYNLHLIQVTNLQKQTLTLKSRYQFPQFHKSLLTSTNDIIISGGLTGYDSKNKAIGKFDLQTKSFNDIFATAMERSSHSLCYVDGMVYIVGGFGREGAERIVEKLNLKTGAVEKEPPCRYGGTNITIATNRSEIVKLSDEGLEVYDTVKKQWSQLMIPNYKYFESCAAVEINDNDIFVFGGYSKTDPESDSGKGVTDTFVLDLSDKFNPIMKMVNRHRLPVGYGFWNNVPVIYKREIYVLQNIESEDSQDCIENYRRVLKFAGNRWEYLQYN